MGANGAGANGAGDGRGARVIALVGPYASGKTSLMEAMLARAGALPRQGTKAAQNTFGDTSPEARSYAMGVELNVADFEFLGDRFTVIDCPGSIEFQADTITALAGVDAAVIVAEPDDRKRAELQLIFKQLEDRNIPHFLFLNKIDKAAVGVREVLSALQPAAATPLVLRQLPIWENGIVTGFIDLALERAFVYREHAPSEIVSLPPTDADRKSDARFKMLEQLADYDDALMEQLLSDIEPPRDRVFDDLARELRLGHICPVLFGSAERGNGVFRLLKALRHEVPDVAETAERLGADPQSSILIIKTLHTNHGGKLSLARVLAGSLTDQAPLFSAHGEERVSGIYGLFGGDQMKKPAARAGDLIALGRLDKIKTSDTASVATHLVPKLDTTPLPSPVLGQALAVADRKDDVKLTAALAKLIDEDPSLSLEHDSAGELVLWGQGEMHLRVTLARLERKFGVSARLQPRQIPYRETIRKPVEIRGRHKKQSGGHGQFGDVVLAIAPQDRGAGHSFTETISGGVVPRQYFPGVEAGVMDGLEKGPLGFPVVDVAVTLKDGSYHTVDSSEQAFRMAARLAMSDGLAQASPVLLEPIAAVDIAVPNDATARINGVISSRRGQILGFDARPDWPGWDVISAHLPEAEIQDLIMEVRSVTAGVGTFAFRFDHLAELTGKLAEQVLARHSRAA